jgi:PAS domain S-box-containing protein
MPYFAMAGFRRPLHPCHTMISASRTAPGKLVCPRSPADTVSPLRALVAGADDALCAWVASVLPPGEWEVVRATRRNDAAAPGSESHVSLVVLDLCLGREVVQALHERFHAAGSALPHVVVVDEGPGGGAVLPGVETLPRPAGAAETRTRLAEALLARAAATARAEAAHRQLERLRPLVAVQHHFFERNPHPMWIHDRETLRFLAVNDAAARTYGYSVDEFLACTLRDVDVAISAASGPDAAVRAPGMHRHRTRGGVTLLMEVLAHDITFGERPARLVLARDVTERDRIEAALRESEQRFRALFDQSPLGVLDFDDQLRVRACNSRLAEELGFANPAALIDFDLTKIQDPQVLGAFRRALSGERTAYEGPYYSRLAGRRAWISMRLSPQYDAAGAVAGGIAIIEDITPRRKTEIRLETQARELEQLNTRLQERTRQLEGALLSRSRLYATLNHELRTPISAMILYSDMLLSGTLGALTEEQADGVQHMQRSAQHLNELVQDVLDLARLEAGKLAMVVEPVQLIEVAHDLLDAVHPLAAHRGSEVRLEVEPTPAILTDGRRVRQIVLNLLSNAVKFGRGRPIALRCAPLPDGGVEISVSDQGAGIAFEDQIRVFEDFVQVGGHRESGSGLGLSISRRLAELLGGRLTLHSELGRGSTFRLVLPAAAPSTPDNLIRYAIDATV